MTIDLCVVTYGPSKNLKRFMDTLYSDYEEGVFSLYVWDNGPEPHEGFHLAKEHPLPTDIALQSKNVGYAKACNEMATFSGSPFIGFCNDDTWMTTADLKSIIQSFEETDADILGPKQRDESGRVRHGGIFGTNVDPKFRGWSIKDEADLLYRDRKDAVTVSGSAYFVRRNVWEALTNDPEYRKVFPDATGAFLPTFFYYEETWCSYFARHRGYRIMYDGTVSIGHTWHGSHEKGDNLDREVVHESRALFRQTCDRLGIEHD